MTRNFKVLNLKEVINFFLKCRKWPCLCYGIEQFWTARNKLVTNTFSCIDPSSLILHQLILIWVLSPNCSKIFIPFYNRTLSKFLDLMKKSSKCLQDFTIRAQLLVSNEANTWDVYLSFLIGLRAINVGLFRRCASILHINLENNYHFNNFYWSWSWYLYKRYFIMWTVLLFFSLIKEFMITFYRGWCAFCLGQQLEWPTWSGKE